MAQALAAGYRRVLCCAAVGSRRGGEHMDPAVAAARIAASSPDSIACLGASRSARNLRTHGLEKDIEWCARESVLDVVPRFVRTVGPAAEVALSPSSS